MVTCASCKLNGYRGQVESHTCASVGEISAKLTLMAVFGAVAAWLLSRNTACLPGPCGFSQSENAD
jgi:hypothetical protein